MLIDSHCHFDFEPFIQAPNSYLEQAKQAGIGAIVIPSVGLGNWSLVAKLCSEYPELYYGLGLHPFFNHQHDLTALELLKAHIETDINIGRKCVAIGECGLDFAIEGGQTLAVKQQQIALLEGQLQLANEFNLPVILHCRKAFPELIQLIKFNRPKAGGVFHAFSGSVQQAQQIIELGIKIGVGGTITYPRAKKTRHTISQLPLNVLMLETDAPDMPVCGYQGEPNRPDRLVDIVDVLTELRGESRAEIERTTSLTSTELFKLKL